MAESVGARDFHVEGVAVIRNRHGFTLPQIGTCPNMALDVAKMKNPNKQQLQRHPRLQFKPEKSRSKDHYYKFMYAYFIIMY